MRGAGIDGGRRTWLRAHSLRMRLTVWYVGAMVVVLGVYAVAVYAFVSRSVSSAFDEQLRNDLFWVVASLYQTNDGDFMLNEPEQLDPQERLPWVQVWTTDGTTLLFRNGEALRRPVPESQAILSEGIATIATETAPMRMLTRRQQFEMQQGAVMDARVIIQVARSEETTREQLRELALILALGLPVAIAVAGLGGYVLARRALGAIERMTEHARTITADRLGDRLPVHNPEDEMGRLAAVFNETLARLEASFEQMRRFTADVSHELRTPLTAIRSVGEVGLRGHRDETAYRGIIGSMLEEADRLASLVDRLLTLSRAETQRARAVLEPVDMAGLAEDAAGHLGVLAEEKGQTIVVEPDGRPAALGDRVALRQALINLIDNAIKFTPPGERIRIAVGGAGDDVVLDVIDSGPGVPPEARPRIFDRFYRVDGVDAGGSGLGLSIARGAVESSGGHLTLERSSGKGSVFRITLPRAADAAADRRQP